MTDVQNRQGGANVRVPPPLFFVAGVAAGWALQNYGAALPLARSAQTVLVVAAVTGVAGLALILAALGLFRKTGQEPEPWKPSPELIGRGPYRFTRNPMYIGMFLLQCAMGFGLNNAWIVLLAPLALLGVHHRCVAGGEVSRQQVRSGLSEIRREDGALSGLAEIGAPRAKARDLSLEALLVELAEEET